MTDFAFDNTPYPIRDDLVAAYRGFWDRLANAGTWWTGEERVAIAAEVRKALTCSYCAERKEALSPYNFPGEHDAAENTPLDALAIDAVHRIITDQTRITKSWVQDSVQAGLSEGKYAELVGVECPVGVRAAGEEPCVERYFEVPGDILGRAEGPDRAEADSGRPGAMGVTAVNGRTTGELDEARVRVEQREGILDRDRGEGPATGDQRVVSEVPLEAGCDGGDSSFLLLLRQNLRGSIGFHDLVLVSEPRPERDLAPVADVDPHSAPELFVALVPQLLFGAVDDQVPRGAQLPDPRFAQADLVSLLPVRLADAGLDDAGVAAGSVATAFELKGTGADKGWERVAELINHETDPNWRRRPSIRTGFRPKSSAPST